MLRFWSGRRYSRRFALVIAKLSSNSTDVSIRSLSAIDEMEMLSEVKLILSDARYCKASLADGISFRKVNIDGNPSTEGKNVELWLSDVDGVARTIKKFNGEDNPGSNDKSKQGRISIRSMKLVLNNNPGINYSDSTSFSDIGELHIKIGKRNSSKTMMEKSLTPIKLRLEMMSSGGNTTILSCSQATSSASENKVIKVWANESTTGRGGSGNSYAFFNCPAGFGLSAVEARTGNIWDSIRFECRDMVGSYSTTTYSSQYGSSGGGGTPGFSSPRCKCPGQGFINSIYMFTGSETDGSPEIV